MSSEGLSALDKNAQICYLYAAAGNGCLAPFKFKKKTPSGHYYLQRAVLSHPTRLLSRTDCGRKEGPKGSKGTSKPILGLGFFQKANVTTRNRKEVVRKSGFI